MRIAELYAMVVALACASGAAKTPEQIFKQVSPSVVVIHVSDATGEAVGLGSGVVIRRGTVITNCHVAQAGLQLEVSRLGRNYAANLRYADPDRDLCELSVPGLPAPRVSLADAEGVQVGQRVYAIGAPEGLELTLSGGLISALRSVAGLRYIQTTASISPGSSGGGLFDDEGRLVGITTFYVSGGQNLNFALPAGWISGLPERATKEAQAAASKAGRKDDWFRRAVALEDQSDWQGLAKLSLAWITEDPLSEVAWFGLGEAYGNLKQSARSVMALEEALRLDPNDADAWTDLAIDYRNVQQYAEASTADQEAVRLCPKDASAWYKLGIDYINLQQYDKALAALQQPVRLNPKDAAAWTDLGIGYIDLQQYGKALAALKEAVRLDPKDATVWIDLGDDYTDLRQYDKALAADQEAVRLNPRNAVPWYDLGVDYCAVGARDEAIEVYQRLQTVDPSQAEKLFNLCILP